MTYVAPAPGAFYGDRSGGPVSFFAPGQQRRWVPAWRHKQDDSGVVILPQALCQGRTGTLHFDCALLAGNDGSRLVRKR